jgi:protein-S-isoprenylcysteine O-methyltransferase Ste14
MNGRGDITSAIIVVMLGAIVLREPRRTMPVRVVWAHGGPHAQRYSDGFIPKVAFMKPRIPPPLMMLVAAALMWALHRWIPLVHWIAPPWTRLGGLPAVVGLGIAMAAAFRFRRAGTTTNPMDPSKASQLVTGGVFRMTRNPMYLGLVLLLTGWAIWLGSASPWFVPPLFAIVITVVQIIPEERALRQRFGEPYRAYQRRVARWIGHGR